MHNNPITWDNVDRVTVAQAKRLLRAAGFRLPRHGYETLVSSETGERGAIWKLYLVHERGTFRVRSWRDPFYRAAFPLRIR